MRLLILRGPWIFLLMSVCPIVCNTVDLLVCIPNSMIALLSQRIFPVSSHDREGGGTSPPPTHRLKGLTAQANKSNIYRVYIVPPYTPYLSPSVLLGLNLLVAESSRLVTGGIRDISPPRTRGAVDRYASFLSKAFGKLRKTHP